MTDEQCANLIRICERPTLFVNGPELESVCAYIDGIHAATGCLTGFREWLVVLLNSGNNMGWQGLVKIRIHNQSAPPSEHVTILGETIAEFHNFTGSTIGATKGLMRVYVRYHGWLLKQDWYNTDQPSYISPYDGIMDENSA